ncbi:Uncharacterized protein Adt_35445 [Abeliophyllum distichum]|uniref:Uncharacterized protein n=1 Tax=Abeliophyllum distichum TaxID=126358 RepID=A0ABD1QER7_9LAMI
MNALRKAAKSKDSPLAVMTIRTESMDIDPEKVKEEMILDEELDLRIIGSETSNMVGKDPSMACHALKVDPKVRPKIQKRRPLSTERYNALKEKVDKLLANEFIR